MTCLEEFEHNGVRLRLDVVLPSREVEQLGKVINRTNDYLMQQVGNVRLMWMPEQRARVANSIPAHESYRLIDINQA